MRRTEAQLDLLIECELRKKERELPPHQSYSEDYKRAFRKAFKESYYEAYDETIRKRESGIMGEGQHRNRSHH